MKKILKFIGKAYAAYAVINLISAAAMYIYGCRKYGRRMMNVSIQLALKAYKERLMQIFNIGKPVQLDVSDMLTWDEI